MIKFKFTNIFLFLLVIFFSSLFSQTFDLNFYFDYGLGHKNWVVYDYEYVEFDYGPFADSSQILNSFRGTLSVTIDYIEFNSDSTTYNLSILKEGVEVNRTIYDTIYVENINSEYSESVTVIEGLNDLGGYSYIFGWIFPDSLVESVIDTFDSVPMYPYSRLYRFYDLSVDSSIYHSDDTLFIHYRPIYTNYYDSYYSVDYILNTTLDVRTYKRYYSYYGYGFSENLIFKHGWYVGIEDPKEELIPDDIVLEQNYPNPFNPITKIRFKIRDQQHIKLVIYDVLGNKISTLVDRIFNHGEHEVIFEGKILSSGIYYYSLISEQKTITKKCLLLK